MTTLTGFAALYGVETIIGGRFREVISPGAFAEAVGRDDVRCLFNHDSNYPLGRTAAGTLRLRDDPRGLWYEVVLDPDNALAQSVASAVRRGDVSGSSFSFAVDPEDERWTAPSRGLPLRRIIRAMLFDVAPVTFPAYQQTTVSARATDDPISMRRLCRAKLDLMWLGARS